MIRKAVKANPELQSYRALREGRIVGVPYYCLPHEWQAPMNLERRADALKHLMAETLHLMINRVRDFDHDIATVLKLLPEAAKREPRVS